MTERKVWRMPHGFLIIGSILVFVTVLTWLIPAGEFERVLDEATGRNIVIPTSFHFVEANPVSPFRMFASILAGLVDAADVIFFTMISYGYMCMLIHVGAFDSGIGSLIRVMGKQDRLLLPILIWIFALMGASFGMYEEAYEFIPVVMGISLALGYDALLGAVVVMGSVGIGFAAAFVNPYTTAIAQGIAELPLFSGLWFRVLCFFVFVTVYTIFCMNYAHKIKKDPSKSFVYGDDFSHLMTTTKEELIQKRMSKKDTISLLIFVGSIVTFVLGSIYKGWYFEEISAVFLISMLLIGIVNGLSLSETCSAVVNIYKEIVYACLVIGIARALIIVMREGKIIDSVCYYLANAILGAHKMLAAMGMVIIQNLINFFIPSGSGQAATSMPIMTPIADIIGLNRQIAVVAFQFGDGFSNLFWPTQAAVDCAIAGCSLSKWYKFFAPLFVILLGLQFLLIAFAVFINLGPF
ncbi:hypothetical protein IX293_000044 [Fusobacterium necrophorum]|nr:TIGR00366 family protein [Fusobacterium necrophorum]MBR8821814.1 hypothetical protein [Fusobacterium necrophorum]